MCGPDTPVADGQPAGCSAGDRPRRWWPRCPICSTEGWRRHDGRTLSSARRGGLLRAFNEAGVIEAADVHVAQRSAALPAEPDERVALAIAFVVRAVRGGSVCVDLRIGGPTQVDDELHWPEPKQWLAAVTASPLLGKPPVLHLRRGPALLRPVLARGAPGAADVLALRRPGRPGDVTALERLFPPGSRSSGRRGGRPVAAAQPCSPGGREPARPPRLHGCWPCSPSRPTRAQTATAHRTGSANRKGGGTPAGGSPARGEPVERG